MELQDPGIFDWAVSCCFQHHNSAECASSQNPRRRDGATRGKPQTRLPHGAGFWWGPALASPVRTAHTRGRGREKGKKKRKGRKGKRGRKGRRGRRAEAAPPSLSGAVRRSKWPPPGRPQPAAIGRRGAEAGCGGPCCAWGGGGGWRGPPRRRPPPGARWCRRPRRSWATRRPS